MATNPYYQRAFSAVAGSLARARQVLNEFALIQAGFDIIGNLTGATKYQLACSDLTSDLEATPEAAYFRTQRALTLVGVRASLLQASVSGPVQIGITVNGADLFVTPLTIDPGERTSTTAAVPVELSLTEIPDDSEIIVAISAPGIGAKGLIVSFLGTITTLLPA